MRTCVRSGFRLLAAILIALATCLLAATPARAATELIKSLDVTYAINADGSIDVTQSYDWQFESTGQRGIRIRLATRESWENDRTKDVVYDISDVQVTSPSGVPTTTQITEQGSASVGYLDIRIGDPNVRLDVDRATYVLTYKLRGALRTFDGNPEFFWDVTSSENPPIDAFNVKVTAPGGVTRARCLVGSDECTSAVADGVANLTGSDVSSGRIISAVAGLVPGSVANAEPTLEPRRISSPEMRNLATAIDVGSDGVAHVTHDMTYAYPLTDSVTLGWTVPTRVAWDQARDLVLDVSSVQLTVDGSPVQVERLTLNPDQSEQATRLSATAARGGNSTGQWRLSYDVRGAVLVEGGRATLQWPVSPGSSYDLVQASATWNLPSDVYSATCHPADEGWSTDLPCKYGDEPTIEGRHVTLTPEILSQFTQNRYVISFDASGVPGVTNSLADSLDRQAELRSRISFGGGFGGFVAMIVGGGILGRILRPRDRRYAAVAPGNLDVDGPVRTVSRDDTVPVRFTPPDSPLWQAGWLVERKFDTSQTAAELVQMAVNGTVTLSSAPLRIRRRNQTLTEGSVQRDIYYYAQSPDEQVVIDDVSLRAMNIAVEAAGRSAESGNLIDQSVQVRRNRWLLAFGVVPFAILFILLASGFTHWLMMVGLGLAVGAFIGMFVGLVTSARKGLSAEGTALRDQVEGFRNYLETAEAEQLDFEANQDIFTRYLPWAVLFDLTERWTKVCAELAEAGHIPPLDTSFMVGTDSIWDLNRAVRDMSRDFGHAGTTTPSTSGGGGSSGRSFFSGGGSGGSSGFSSSSSGGGGGGGSSSSSW